MLRWMASLMTLVAAATTLVGSYVEAVLAFVNDAAAVTEPADRGAQLSVIEPDLPTTTRYGIPMAAADRAGWSATHSAYPATDIFLGCGATIVSPVDGTVLDVRRVDSWNAGVDDPATRGGRSVAILGYDGVRYYLAHFDTIEASLAVGDAVTIAQVLGMMGTTGRSSACHTHFSISPPCPGEEWRVRRGVVWPYPYLDDWRRGLQTSPADEVEQWVADHPTACDEAIAEAAAASS